MFFCVLWLMLLSLKQSLDSALTHYLFCRLICLGGRLFRL